MCKWYDTSNYMKEWASNLEYISVLFLCWIVPFVHTVIHRRILWKERMVVFPFTIWIAAVPFVIWDIIAHYRDHWSFNARYITGISLLHLPIEEYFFFLLIPYACLLIWVLFTKYQSWSQLKADIFYHFQNTQP